MPWIKYGNENIYIDNDPDPVSNWVGNQKGPFSKFAKNSSYLSKTLARVFDAPFIIKNNLKKIPLFGDSLSEASEAAIAGAILGPVGTVASVGLDTLDSVGSKVADMLPEERSSKLNNSFDSKFILYKGHKIPDEVTSKSIIDHSNPYTRPNEKQNIPDIDYTLPKDEPRVLSTI